MQISRPVLLWGATLLIALFLGGCGKLPETFVESKEFKGLKNEPDIKKKYDLAIKLLKEKDTPAHDVIHETLPLLLSKGEYASAASLILAGYAKADAQLRDPGGQRASKDKETIVDTVWEAAQQFIGANKELTATQEMLAKSLELRLFLRAQSSTKPSKETLAKDEEYRFFDAWINASKKDGKTIAWDKFLETWPADLSKQPTTKIGQWLHLAYIVSMGKIDVEKKKEDPKDAKPAEPKPEEKKETYLDKLIELSLDLPEPFQITTFDWLKKQVPDPVSWLQAAKITQAKKLSIDGLDNYYAGKTLAVNFKLKDQAEKDWDFSTITKEKASVIAFLNREEKFYYPFVLQFLNKLNGEKRKDLIVAAVLIDRDESSAKYLSQALDLQFSCLAKGELVAKDQFDGAKPGDVFVLDKKGNARAKLEFTAPFTGNQEKIKAWAYSFTPPEEPKVEVKPAVSTENIKSSTDKPTESTETKTDEVKPEAKVETKSESKAESKADSKAADEKAVDPGSPSKPK